MAMVKDEKQKEICKETMEKLGNECNRKLVYAIAHMKLQIKKVKQSFGRMKKQPFNLCRCHFLNI